MLRIFFPVLIVSAVALAAGDPSALIDTHQFPDSHDSDSPPLLRNAPDRPEKSDPPELGSGEFSRPDYEQLIGRDTHTFRQVLPGELTLTIQTSDLCDSDDAVGFASERITPSDKE